MNNLSDIATVKSLLSRHGMTFSKALGQNFLVDPSVCPRMAECAVLDRSMGVIEIGPGVGVLTRELAGAAGKVVAVELDRRLLAILEETLGGFTNVEVVNADVLKLNLSAFIAERFAGMRVAVCANLPYYITSPVIMALLESRLPLESITVMVQKEAADRLCAGVGTRSAGAVTVAVNYYAVSERLFDVPRSAFLPQPNVDSTVIRLAVRKEPPVQPKSERLFFAMVKAAFSQRRKTALNSISAGLGVEKSVVASALESTGLAADVRAEKLDMQQLCGLCDEIYDIKGGRDASGCR